MVLAPEHPLVDAIVPDRVARRTRRSSGAARSASTSSRPRRSRRTASSRRRSRELERQAEGQREDRRVHRRVRHEPRPTAGTIPIFIADYVLMGYGTGAIMAVPGARPARLRVRRRVRPADRRRGAAARRLVRGAGSRRRAGVGVARGLHRRRRRHGVDQRRGVARRPGHRRRQGPHHRVARGGGRGRGRGHLQAARLAVQPPALLGRAVPDRLRRRRRAASRCPESMLPVELPELDDFEPRDPRRRRRQRSRSRRSRAPTTGCTSSSTSATARSAYRRETNTMPQWAGSCWYYLRYLDPTNENALVDPEVERYWMGDGGRRRRRPLRRRRRARGAAPALRALLAQGAVRPRPRVDARAVPAAVQPGLRSPRPAFTDERGVVRRGVARSRSATGRGSTTAPRSSATTGRWARA